MFYKVKIESGGKDVTDKDNDEIIIKPETSVSSFSSEDHWKHVEYENKVFPGTSKAQMYSNELDFNTRCGGVEDDEKNNHADIKSEIEKISHARIQHSRSR